LGWGFSDELVATGLLLAVMVTGSFYYLSRISGVSGEVEEEMAPAQEQVLGSVVEENGLEEAGQGGEPSSMAVATPTVTPSPTASVAATPVPTQPPGLATPVIEIAYGTGGRYENDSYFVEFNNPKLTSSSSRVFRTEVVIGNKTVQEGLSNRLHATVIKDGQVLIDQAAMSISEVKQIFPGQKLTFTASLSLVVETDITKLIYNPREGLPSVTHVLQPGFE
jgi:hypothetical protein